MAGIVLHQIAQFEDRHRINRAPYSSATTGFTSSPMPSTVTVTTSPGTSQRGGLRAKPTPAGVPVEMMSPGSSVKTLERYAISFGILKIRLLVFESATSRR